MSEFNLRLEANQQPTTCRFCGSYEGPFVDTNVDDDHYGHIWICAPISDKRAGCAGMIAFLLGWTDPLETVELKERINQMEAQLSERDTQDAYLHIPWSVASPYITTYTNGVGTYTIDTVTASTVEDSKPRRRRRKEED